MQKHFFRKKQAKATLIKQASKKVKKE